MIDPSAEQRLEKLLKLVLGSDKEGEVVAAARAIKRTLNSAGSDIHELAERIRGGKLSGVQDGKDAAATAQGFSSTEGPSYLEMATYCLEHDTGRLTPKERGFVEDMTRWCTRREPSEKQGRWLHVLYVKAGRQR